MYSQQRFAAHVVILAITQSSSHGGFHRKALTEPCVYFPIHTLLINSNTFINREPSVQTIWALSFVFIYLV